MPHPPRWYDERLSVRDSGAGGIGAVDPVTGRYGELTAGRS